MNYFYADKSGAIIGPVYGEKLRMLCESGKLPDHTQVRSEGTKQWFPLVSLLRAMKSRGKRNAERWTFGITAALIALLAVGYVIAGRDRKPREPEKPRTRVWVDPHQQQDEIDTRIRAERQRLKDLEERTRPR